MYSGFYGQQMKKRQHVSHLTSAELQLQHLKSAAGFSKNYFEYLITLSYYSPAWKDKVCRDEKLVDEK